MFSSVVTPNSGPAWASHPSRGCENRLGREAPVARSIDLRHAGRHDEAVPDSFDLAVVDEDAVGGDHLGAVENSCVPDHETAAGRRL
jgi:hypothetical protein